MKKENRVKDVFFTDKAWEAEQVRSLLESHNIPTILKNAGLQDLFGGTRFFTNTDGRGSITVAVPTERAEEAEELVDAFFTNQE